MEEKTKEFKDYIDAFRRRRKSILSVASVIFVISVIAALLWPPTYRSAATILIEEQEIPSDLIRSTITSYATQRIQTISQRVMTRANLMQIIEKYDLYHNMRRSDTTEDILDRMRKDIKIDMINADVIDPRSGQPRPATIAFTLSYDGERAEVTQKVANELTTLFLNENLKSRTEKATETYSFLSEEANRLKEHIAGLEAQIASFKEKNAGDLPELATINAQVAERTERELFDTENQMRSLDNQRFYLEGQLAQINPMMPTMGEGGEQILDPVTKLKTLRAQYASATAKYAPDHPDVVRLRREIESLEKQTGAVNASAEKAKELAKLRTELATAKQKYSPDHPDVIRLTKEVASMEEALKQKADPELEIAKEKPDNPAYLTMQAQVEAIKNQYQALENQRNAQKAKLAEYERRMQRTPETERKYLELTRDRDNSVKRFQEIVAKRGEAQVGQELEKERKGERFSLIDPPQLPEKPIMPNRPVIIILGFLLSMGGGVGYAAMMESVDSSIYGTRGLAAALEVPPLAEIPYMRNNADIAREQRTKKIAIAALASGFVLFILLVHLFVIPLDVLWFKGLRKIDSTIGG
jgi:succinoglycan biosynthesis transport protein ExoP